VPPVVVMLARLLSVEHDAVVDGFAFRFRRMSVTATSFALGSSPP